MIDNRDALERRLSFFYEGQLPHYDNAIRILDEAEDQDDGAPWVDALQAALQQVAKIDRQMTADKAAWTDGAFTPGAPLKKILDVLADRIQQLGERVDRRIAGVTARRDNLLPEATALVRQRQMLNAYAAR